MTHGRPLPEASLAAETVRGPSKSFCPRGGRGILAECRHHQLGLWWAIELLSICVLSAIAELAPTRLRCEYRDNPLGIDTPRPRLSWAK